MLVHIACLNCSRKCLKRKDEVDKGRTKFCTKSCRSTYTAKKYHAKQRSKVDENKRKAIIRFLSKINKTSGVTHPIHGKCWTWLGSTFKSGRGQFLFEGKNQLAHRVMYQIKFGQIPNDLFVCHKCDNGWCLNPDHFFLGTNRDNKDDCVAKNRQAKGEAVNTARLTEHIILEAKKLIKSGKSTYRELEQKYGKSSRSLRAAVKGETWKHLKNVD